MGGRSVDGTAHNEPSNARKSREGQPHARKIKVQTSVLITINVDKYKSPKMRPK